MLKETLTPLEMWDFDVIFGMNWLSIHRVLVDYFTKKVVFLKPRFIELEFEGDHRVLSMCAIAALEAKRLLHKGCKAYLTHVINTSTPKVTLKSVSIMRGFSNMFLEDLPRFPLERELEFDIDLLPSSTPIFILPYRMVPARLKKLKMKLQDLVDNCFIRLNVSP